MNSLYTDSNLASGYLRLMELSHAASHSPDQSDIVDIAFDTYYESLLRRAYASLQYVSSQNIPELHLHTWHRELDTLTRLDAETTFTDQRGIHVGLSFVSKLDAAILVLSAYLMENYLWQVSPLVVDTQPVGDSSDLSDTPRSLSMYTEWLPSISEVVELDNFPEEALSLYAVHLIPEAEAEDGYQKRPFQLIIEYLQENYLAKGRKADNQRGLARALPKPLLDLVEYSSNFDSSKAVQAYQDPDKGPFLLRLHLQLLLDGLYFVLAHELAHYQLGHLEHRETAVTQLRTDEAASDAAALALLHGISGFQARSLVILFNFASHNEPEVPPDRMDHPLAHNRLLILAETLLAEPGSDSLRADVNAGLALLPSRLEPQYLTFGWPDETPEDVDIYISSYADMDYTAHVMVYIDRQPRQVELFKDAYVENAFLLAHLAYKIYFEVRDRINPGEVYAWGGAGYHPTIRPTDLFHNNRTETVLSRLHLTIPAPPEFCLKWPGAEFVVKKIEVMYRTPDLKSPEETRNPVRFFYEPVELELSDFLQSLSPISQDPTLRSRLLLAARRYMDYGSNDASIQIYQWLYRQDPESLTYSDLVSLATQLIDYDRFAEAAEIARWAVGPGRAQRPGFHYILALDHAAREDALEAYEEAFLEMALFGMYGEMFNHAREMIGKIAAYATDLVMGAMRTFMTHRDAAGQALEQGEYEQALNKFQEGRDALLAGQSHVNRDFVFLHQLLSDITLSISELEGYGFDVAVDAAQTVLALRPDFVPALMNLARIAQIQGDRKTALTLWQQAHEIAPFNSIVFDKRKEFEYELS